MKTELEEMRRALDELDLPLRKQRAKLILQARAIVDKAIAAHRDFTEEERTEYRRLMGSDETGTQDGEIARLTRSAKIEDALREEKIQKNSKASRLVHPERKTKVMQRSTFEALSAKEKMAWVKVGGTLVDG
jgi:hypothetical protein